MGSCFSKSDRDPAGTKHTTGNSRFSRNEQKLGGNDTAGNGNQINEKYKNNTNGSVQGSNTRNHGKTLGGEETNEKNPNTKEAAAKAAEMRYNKQRQLLKESQDKLKTMSKKSKLEKGLQS